MCWSSPPTSTLGCLLPWPNAHPPPSMSEQNPAMPVPISRRLVIASDLIAASPGSVARHSWNQDSLSDPQPAAAGRGRNINSFYLDLWHDLA